MSQRTVILRDERAMQALRLALSNWRTAAALETPLTVTVAEYKARRTSAQNALLWAVLTEIAVAVKVGGKEQEVEVWHEWAKQKFIGIEEVTLPDGTNIVRGLSTSRLNVADFSLMIDRLIAYAVLDLGLELTTKCP